MAETLKSCTGFLSVSTVNERRQWCVIAHNSPVCADGDRETALAVALRTFGKVRIPCWDGDRGEFVDDVELDNKKETTMTGKEICKLMRQNKVGIKDLSQRTQITMKRIREVRKDGLADAATVRDWTQAITGKDPVALERRGNFLELGVCPRVGENVWAIVNAPGSLDYVAVPAVVDRADNIDDKGLGNTYLTVTTVHGEKRVCIDCAFTHRPELVEVEDAYGPTKKWAVPAVDKGERILDAICGLASGTLAGLTGEAKYDALEDMHGKFIHWAQARIRCFNPDLSWETWQDAWSGFIAAHPHCQKPATVAMWTTAPHDYDGFGTRTVDAQAGYDDAKLYRQVEVQQEHEEWQRARYFSGYHAAYDDANWRQLVASGMVTEGAPPPAKAEPMPSASRVTKAPAILERGGLRAEQWPNRLGWNVGPHEVLTGEFDLAGCMSVTLDADGARRTLIIDGTADPLEAVALALSTEEAEAPDDDDGGEGDTDTPPVDLDAPLVRPLLLLPPNLAALAKLTAKVEHARFGATSGVQLRTTGRGYRAVATDGRVLGIVAGELPDKPEDYPLLPALEAAPGTEAEAVIPADAWVKAFRGLPKRGKPILQNLAVAVGKDGSTLASTDLDAASVMQPRHLDGRFPAVECVLPEGTPLVSFRIDPDLFCRLLAVAAAFRGDGNLAVTVEVHSPAKPIVVRVAGGGQEFVGLVVPLTR